MVKKIIIGIVVLLLLALSGFVYYKYYFVFAEGVKSGQINFITKKGYIWKTYEGRLVQNGLKAQNQAMQSFTFDFSIEDEQVAKKLELINEGFVTLHYLEYKTPLPWRGNSNFVVDSIVVLPTNNVVIEQQSSNKIQKETDNLGDYPTEWYE